MFELRGEGNCSRLDAAGGFTLANASELMLRQKGECMLGEARSQRRRALAIVQAWPGTKACTGSFTSN